MNRFNVKIIIVKGMDVENFLNMRIGGMISRRLEGLLNLVLKKI
jgi:hypothetical protein